MHSTTDATAAISPLRIQVTAYLTAVACLVASVSGSAREYHDSVNSIHRINDRNLARPNDGEAIEVGLLVSEKTTAKKAAEAIEFLTGYAPPNPGACGHLEVGPLDAQELSPKEFWLALISPHVKIIRSRERLDTRPDVVATMWRGEEVMDFSIERDTRREIIQKFPFKYAFLPHGGRELVELETQVGPIRGRMSMNDALRIFIGDDDFYIRWYHDRALDPQYTPSIEPRHDETLYADMSESACSFGYKELPRVTVTETRLPSLQDDVASPVEVFDRERIERSGVASIPELLRYATQTAFTRAPGYRLNGAQYAEGRGVGPAMVLIEGHRTMASASSLQDSAFDLNTIPLSAVERVEVVPDSGSILHGVDALGGMVNIVLRRPSETISSEARYGVARGGAIERRFTALARTESSALDGVIIADQLEVTNLLGHERRRYADQDYTRYAGGIDRRSPTSEQGNLQSGFGSPLLGLPVADDRGSFDAGELSAQPNLTSLFRYQSIAPARSRASLVATGQMDLAAIDISGNAIYTRQDTSYTLPPPTVIALVARDHPQNSLHQPILYYGMLTGIGSQQFETGTDLFRAALAFNTRAAGWAWELSVAYTQETYSNVLTNVLDPVALAASLTADDAATALHFFADRPGAGRIDLLAPLQPERFEAIASHARIAGDREFALFPAGDALVKIGADWRNEKIDFAGVDPNAARDAFGSYLNLRVPVLLPVVLSAGARQDRYSDGDSITNGQLGFEWTPTASLKVHGYLGERYRPPSLYELHATLMSFDLPVTDPKTGQTNIATALLGGRRNLKPTTAASSGLGATLSTAKDFELSLYYWHLSVQDRISILPLQMTLEHEEALPGRVFREPSTGRIQSIDIGWQNLGEVEAAGVDLRVRKEFRVWGGKLSSELGLTWNTRYSFRDLPASVSPLTDRVGIAAEHGTILRHRVVGQIAWENHAWRVVSNVIEQPRYTDITLAGQGAATVSSQTLLDVNISRRWGTSSLTLGALNLFDTEPGYSNVSVAGYDPSQGDLRGRFVYGEVRLGF